MSLILDNPGVADALAAEAAAAEAGLNERTTWTCPTCTFANPASVIDTCQMCGMILELNNEQMAPPVEDCALEEFVEDEVTPFRAISCHDTVVSDISDLTPDEHHLTLKSGNSKEAWRPLMPSTQEEVAEPQWKPRNSFDVEGDNASLMSTPAMVRQAEEFGRLAAARCELEEIGNEWVAGANHDHVQDLQPARTQVLLEQQQQPRQPMAPALVPTMATIPTAAAKPLPQQQQERRPTPLDSAQAFPMLRRNSNYTPLAISTAQPQRDPQRRVARNPIKPARKPARLGIRAHSANMESKAEKPTLLQRAGTTGSMVGKLFRRSGGGNKSRSNSAARGVRSAEMLPAASSELYVTQPTNGQKTAEPVRRQTNLRGMMQQARQSFTSQASKGRRASTSSIPSLSRRLLLEEEEDEDNEASTELAPARAAAPCQGWTCTYCSIHNENMEFLACSMCGMVRLLDSQQETTEAPPSLVPPPTQVPPQQQAPAAAQPSNWEEEELIQQRLLEIVQLQQQEEARMAQELRAQHTMTGYSSSQSVATSAS